MYNLARLRKLAIRRHPLWESNRVMKWFFRVVAAYYLLCLILPGILLGYVSHRGAGREGFDNVDGILVVFLALDFLLRFLFFQTPAQVMKPFRLLPVRRRRLLRAYLIGIGSSAFNLLWMAFLVPLGLLGILPYAGVTALLGWLIGWWLMMVMNSYAYLLCRTLILRHWLWLLLPLALFAALIYFGLCYDPLGAFLFHASVTLARGWLNWQLWAFLLPLGAAAALFLLNFPLQQRMVYRELAGEGEAAAHAHVATPGYRWLSSLGIYGEYLKLELRSIRRNKTIRMQFVALGACMLLFCVILAFTDVYDAPFMRCFILAYCLYGTGGTQVLHLMQPEGNYIDLLMSRRESVLVLLKAKYLFSCLLILLPLLVLLIPMAQGKLHPIEVLGFALFTLGAIFPLFFQAAAYNKQTLALNQKLTKQGSSSQQLIISLAGLFVPSLLLHALGVLLPVWLEGLILSLIGLIGIILSPWWIRAVYNRFMRRRYVNMEGFRASRTY